MSHDFKQNQQQKQNKNKFEAVYLFTTLTAFPPSVLQTAVSGDIFGVASSGLSGVTRKCERSWPNTMTTTTTPARAGQLRRSWWVYLVLTNRFSQASSGWMGNDCELTSSGLSAHVLWGLSLGFGWTTQTQSETCPVSQCCVGCIVQMIVLLKGEPSPKSHAASLYSRAAFLLCIWFFWFIDGVLLRSLSF